MADLGMLDFDGTKTTDAMRTKLRSLRKKELIDLLDICIVVRPERSGIQIEPSTSALFLLIATATPDKVIAEIEEFRPRVLKTSLSSEQGEKLRDALARHGA